MNPVDDSEIPSSIGKPSRQFLSTYWPMVRSAGTPGPQREQALGKLVCQYSPALKQYVRKQFGLDDSTCDDIVQGFLVDKVVKLDIISRANEGGGKFRTFLLTAIHNSTLAYLRRERAQKRIPPDRLVPLDDASGNDPALAAACVETFDNAFVRQVLTTAVHRLRQYCAAHDQNDAWTVFYHRVLAPTLEIAEPPSHDELATRLGLATAGDSRNRLAGAKRILKRELAAIVAEYANNSAEAEEELAELSKLIG